MQSPVPLERWDVEAWYAPDIPPRRMVSYTRFAAFCTNIDRFEVCVGVRIQSISIVLAMPQPCCCVQPLCVHLQTHRQSLQAVRCVKLALAKQVLVRQCHEPWYLMPMRKPHVCRRSCSGCRRMRRSHWTRSTAC